MKRTKRIARWLVVPLILAGLAAGLMIARPAAAGGWATVTVDHLPGDIVAGRPVTIRFTVRQHGQTPLAGLTPTLTVIHTQSGHSLKTAVHEMKQPGRYEVTMTLPESGQWSWSIHTFGTVYSQPPLAVAPAAAAPAAAPGTTAWPPVAGSAALLAAGVMVVGGLRRRRRIWLAGAAGCLLVALAAFGWQWLRPALAAEPVAATSKAASCPVSELVYDQPAKDPNADPFGSGPWVVNDDRSIWVGLPPDGSWPAGEGQKVIWIRPAGTELTIDGRLLDGDAPPLEAAIPCCYTTGFQVTGLTFPAAGCWQVTATAGDSRLDFTTWVSGVPESETAAAGAALDGEALFVSKGCIQCHQNDNVTLVAAQSFSIGPDLTTVKREAGFLRRWLADPPAVKPGTMMPNLGLNAAEIEALIAFLGAD